MKFDKIYENIERKVIYIVLCVFIFLELAGVFIPEISDLMQKRGSVILLTMLILFTFRFIDKNLTSQNQYELNSINKFTADVQSIFKKTKYKKIKILAHSSFKYLHAISESGIEIENLQLLVRDINDINLIQIPVEKDSKEEFCQNTRQLLKRWEVLYQSGKIKNLEIYFYPFESLLHFMIIDNEILHFGLLKPIKEFPGTDLISSYYFDKKFKNSNEIINSFNTEFESIKEGFGKKY